MMESMIAESGVTFKELEKNIYAWVCQIGRQFTREFMERYDRMLMEGRNRKKYRHKGFRQTTIKTVYGEVTYLLDGILNGAVTAQSPLHLKSPYRNNNSYSVR